MSRGPEPRPAIVITGSAAGIGREFARLAPADGHALILVDRNRDGLEALTNQLTAVGREAHCIVADLSQPDVGDTIEAELSRRGLYCDILVNNAGFGLPGFAVDSSLAEQIRLVDLQTLTLTDLTLRFLPAMIARRAGGIIDVSSVVAYGPGPYAAVYNATKQFVLRLNATLRRELTGSGVKICCLAPGKVQTGMWPPADNSPKTLLFRLPTISAEQAAAAGWRGFERGSDVVIPQLFFRVAALVLRFLPTRLYLLLATGRFTPVVTGVPAAPNAGRPAIVVIGEASDIDTEVMRLASSRSGEVVVVGSLVDLSLREAGARIEQVLKERGLYCDLLVNTGQIDMSGALTRLDRQEAIRWLTASLRTTTDLALRFLPGMVARRHGAILLAFRSGAASPIAGVVGAYTTWLGKALACETRPAGITVSVTPGQARRKLRSLLA